MATNAQLRWQHLSIVRQSCSSCRVQTECMIVSLNQDSKQLKDVLLSGLVLDNAGGLKQHVGGTSEEAINIMSIQV